MSELRQDQTTGEVVIIAPQRGRRPNMREAIAPPERRTRFDPTCPFCPGHEAQLPGLIDELPATGGSGWSVRVVPNKFPAVQPGPRAHPPANGHQARSAQGRHEVIIESPRHDAEPAIMSAEELTRVVSVYRARLHTLLAQDNIATAILFRNYGQRAGSSITHPHAQIIALDFVPAKVAAIGDWGERYYTEHARCAMCEELEIEGKNGKRIVEENDAFVALVPFAATHSFELWVVPKRHQASFAMLDDAALPALAAMLGRSLQRLRTVLHDPAYNFVVDTAPKNKLATPYWHWRLRIVPDIAIAGGFELGASVLINPSSPEDDARLLRKESIKS